MRPPKPRSVSKKAKTAQSGKPKAKAAKKPKAAAKKTSPSRTTAAQVWKTLSSTVALDTAQSRGLKTRSFGVTQPTLTPSTRIDEVYLTFESKVKLAATLQRTYHVPIDRDDLNRANTFDDLVNIIVAKLPTSPKGFEQGT